MSPKEEILAYLRKFLQQPALDRIAGYDDVVFDRATESLTLIHLELGEQVKRYCLAGRASLWNVFPRNTPEDLRVRCAKLERCQVARLLVQQLGGTAITRELDELFAGRAANILSSTAPLVMKVREHLGVAMVIFELVNAHAFLPTIQALQGSSGNTSEDPKEASARVAQIHHERLDAVVELFDFRRNATD